MRSERRCKRISPVRAAVTSMTVVSMLTASAGPVRAQTATTTPIQHVIIVIGENRSFDHMFATYQPKSGQTIQNLLSKGIVNADGTPGPNFALATQFQASDTTTYTLSPGSKTPYTTLPPPNTDGAPRTASDTDPPPFADVATVAAFESEADDGLDKADYSLLTTGATGLSSETIDTRITNVNTLPNGPFQLTNGMPYDSYTASPVHRFYQMRQETDCAGSHITTANPSGCLNDLFPWVEVTIGTGSNGDTQPAAFTAETTGEGASSMGFYNMAAGDVPYFKQLADQYTISDNFHQSIMGGTGANHIALGTGLAIYYTDGQGNIATPPGAEVEDPNPAAGTNNWYMQDGFSGGSYSNCSNSTAAGVSAVLTYLNGLPNRPASKCATGAYYLLNNYNPGYLGNGTLNTSTFTIPPSQVPTIGDTLNGANISWRYYGAGWNNYVAAANGQPTIANADALYCNICNPFLYETSIMTNANQRATHLGDIVDFDSAVTAGTLPAVSFVKPDMLLDGHPASSKLSLFEAFARHVVNEVQANPQLWATTAILITWDEGGGYWDSGYIQPLDFFGDGTRIPAIMVSPYSTGGLVTHTYGDHASVLKFIEKNWRLSTVSKVGRDNLPNPITRSSNPYAPVNGPAIGDLMEMFTFTP
jgi:phospholipase C